MMSFALVQPLACAVLALLVCGTDCRGFNDNETIETFACKIKQLSVVTPTCAHHSGKHVINLSALHFGYLEHNENCTNETRGCEEDVSDTQFQDALVKMSGRQQSDPYFFPPNILPSTKCPQSNFSASLDYMIAYYDCIDSSHMESMCSNLNQESREIYLWNEGYPDEGASLDNELCECGLNVTSDVIEVHTYYNELSSSQNMTLQYTSHNATEYVVWDGSRHVYHHQVINISVAEYNMTLTWINDEDGYNNRTGKYWIKLKAINGSIHIKCPLNDVHTETTVTQLNATVTLAATANPKIDTHNHSKNSSTDLQTKITENILNTTDSNTKGTSGKSKSGGGKLDKNLLIAICGGAAGVIAVVIIIVTVVIKKKHAKEKLIDQRLSQLGLRQSESGGSGRHDQRINNPIKHNSKRVEDETELTNIEKKHHVSSHARKEEAARRPTSSAKKHTRTEDDARRPTSSAETHERTEEAARRPTSSAKKHTRTEEAARRPTSSAKQHTSTEEAARRPTSSAKKHTRTEEAVRRPTSSAKKHTRTEEDARRPTSSAKKHTRTEEAARRPTSSAETHERTEEDARRPTSSDKPHERTEEAARKPTSSAETHERSEEAARRPTSSAETHERTEEAARRPTSSAETHERTEEAARKPTSSAETHERTEEAVRRPTSSAETHERTEEAARKPTSSAETHERSEEAARRPTSSAKTYERSEEAARRPTSNAKTHERTEEAVRRPTSSAETHERTEEAVRSPISSVKADTRKRSDQ